MSVQVSYLMPPAWYDRGRMGTISRMMTSYASPSKMHRRCETKGDLVRMLQGSADDLRALGVSKMGVFGSFRHDAAGADSDVDLLVEFEPGQKTFDHFVALAGLLEEALQRPVELVTPEALSPHVGPHILREVEYVPLGA